MLISRPIADGIRAGTVAAQYRKWDSPRVTVGGTQVTSAGVVRFAGVTRVDDVDGISDEQARAAGMADADTLRAALAKSRRGAHVYRVDLVWVSEDPRVELRNTLPDDAECAQIATRLGRLDRRATGPWTRDILEWIRDNPRVVSTRLAEQRGVDRAAMKVDIRKLKALGLTISHDVGYQVSPRGEAYLRWLAAR
ncbi:MAG: ASCH domain-containing protein [Gordonia sp. (in: high G+C Gram-positive bacteria)]|uniref:ASCH domain-containing protein n=1 Tax=Gordonia sp. (in: high G+C Gram-positive bacteria) TaxID=84139 RepID=UPI0039E35D4B